MHRVGNSGLGDEESTDRDVAVKRMSSLAFVPGRGLMATASNTMSEESARARRVKFDVLAAHGETGMAAREAAFALVDSNNDGVVTLKEALEAIAILWEDFDSISACMMAYSAADRDGTGLTWRETRVFFEYQLFYDDAWEAFQQVDVDGDGTINRAEFAAIKSDMLGITNNPFASFDDAFDEIDLDHSGMIDLREFCAWLGQQHYADSEEELADVARAFDESASWFGLSDEELVEVARAKDAAFTAAGGSAFAKAARNNRCPRRITSAIRAPQHETAYVCVWSFV
jgi:Ca2+-binding EF-hand superfamily protein